MSQVPVRVNLTAMGFPFLSEYSGRSVIVKQQDQNYIPSTTSKDLDTREVGIPQLYYCHNIIATAQGYQAIGYQLQTAVIGMVNNFAGQVSVTEASTGNKAYIGFTASGQFYSCRTPYYVWNPINTIPAAAGKTVTTAYVNGVTYVYIAEVGCYTFNFGTGLLVAQVLTGLTASAILGITAVQGYLLAWTKSSIAWSSLIDPTDFTPSLVTGAGGGSVQGAEGDIVACIPHTIGMIVYTNQNAVAAPTSGNARYPFNFRKLVASGGIASKDLVTYDANTGNHYSYTTSGLQTVSLQQTQTTLPEVTDFLAGSVFEDFDEATQLFSNTALSTVMKKRFQLVSDRYLVISYGVTEYTHALIYDLSLKRWGKLKFTHIEVFEFALLTAETVETPRHSIAMLKKDGSVNIVNIDAADLGSSGVVILGKYSYVRSRTTNLETIDVENVPDNATFKCIDRYALDGKNTQNKTATLIQSGHNYRKFGVHCVAVNHSLLFMGAFHLVSLVLNVVINGRR